MCSVKLERSLKGVLCIPNGRTPRTIEHFSSTCCTKTYLKKSSQNLKRIFQECLVQLIKTGSNVLWHAFFCVCACKLIREVFLTFSWHKIIKSPLSKDIIWHNVEIKWKTLKIEDRGYDVIKDVTSYLKIEIQVRFYENDKINTIFKLSESLRVIL